MVLKFPKVGAYHSGDKRRNMGLPEIPHGGHIVSALAPFMYLIYYLRAKVYILLHCTYKTISPSVLVISNNLLFFHLLGT